MTNSEQIVNDEFLARTESAMQGLLCVIAGISADQQAALIEARDVMRLLAEVLAQKGA